MSTAPAHAPSADVPDRAADAAPDVTQAADAPSLPTTPTSSARLSPWVRRLVWANLVGQIGIIVTGGAVRLTGSGLGCSTWPQCEPGSFTPQLHEATSAHTYIEFGNRMVTGILLVIAVALAVAVRRNRALPTWFRRLALVPVGGVVAQALIGGITVLAKLNPAVVGVHMLVSLTLVAASALLVARGPGTPPRTPVDPRVVRLANPLVVVGGILMMLGIVVTGAGPHGGDDEYAYRYAIDPVLAAKVHAGAVWLFVLLLAGCLWALRRDALPPATRRAWYALAAVTLAQGAIGYIQYLTGLPAAVVAAHLLGTGVLAATLAWARSSVRPAGAPSSRAAG